MHRLGNTYASPVTHALSFYITKLVVDLIVDRPPGVWGGGRGYFLWLQGGKNFLVHSGGVNLFFRCRRSYL